MTCGNVRVSIRAWYRLRMALLALATVGCLMGPVGAIACPSPPPPVRDLAPPRFYGDAKGSTVDPELARAHREAVAPLKAFLGRVVSDTDKALRRRSAAAAACPLAWIEAWAKAGAWLGNMGSKQAEYQRKWDLAGVALAYLKLRSFALPSQRAVIEPWLGRIAEKAKAFQLASERKRNNHLYWLGLSLAATALATDTPRYWDDARQIMSEALGHIGPDGTLPLELERGQRALHYHAFATTALVAMAELAALKGEDWYGLAGGSLHRLVARTASGLAAPHTFDALARAPQDHSTTSGAGWLWLYQARFPGRLSGPLPDVPEKHRWLGGDVKLLPRRVE
ncbi:MAG: alginate lyase family protein [Hyphomicrobiaceae bacterium]